LVTHVCISFWFVVWASHPSEDHLRGHPYPLVCFRRQRQASRRSQPAGSPERTSQPQRGRG
jgi:hypothetical protein